MKIKILLCFLYLGSLSHAQDKANINTSNYYDHYVNFPQLKAKGIQGKNLTTNWLRKNEVIPIVIEELKSAGYENLSDNVLFKTTQNQYLVSDLYSNKSNFGFLYIAIHGLPLKDDRKEFIKGFEHTFYAQTESGKPDWITIKKMPKNIFILNENFYYYQYTEVPADLNILLSKPDAIKILREDIKAYLLSAPKPVK